MAAEEAVNALVPMIKDEGDDESLAVSSAFSALGDAYFVLGKTAEAIRMYESALKYDSEDDEVKDKLAEARLRPQL